MRKIPFLRLTILLILGIIIQTNYDLENSLVIIGLISTFCTSVLSYFLSKRVYGWIPFFGISILSLFFSLGLYSSMMFQLNQDKNHFHLKLSDSELIFYGVILEKDNGRKNTKYVVDIKSLQNADTSTFKYTVGGKLLIFAPIDTFLLGDEIRFKTTPNLISGNNNEFGFDYKKYCSRKQIYYSGYSKTLSLIRRDLSFIAHLRNSISNSLMQIDVDESTRAVLFAMILGNKDRLENVESIFRKTGTSHVLAISGLHVGIISAILFFILSFLPVGLQWLKYIFIILGIWLFCLLSGLAPSTVRACIMMTCFFVGKYFKANGLGYNFVFLAAFFMLLRQPTLIYDIGFQFSFLAILGILYFFEPLSKALVFRGVKERIWQMLILSLCAQLLITPISLYYFHQFPILFAFTSMIAIPATFIIIAVGMAVVSLFSIGIPLGILESLLDWFTSIFLSLLEIFADCDSMILTNLWPSNLEIFLYYTGIFSVSIFFQRKNLKFLYVFIGSFILLLVVQFAINSDLTVPKIIVYSDSKDIVIDIIHSGVCLTIYEEGVFESSLNWKQSGRHNKSHIIKHELFQFSNSINHTFQLKDYKVFVLNKPVMEIPKDVNLLLLNAHVELETMCLNVNMKIIDFAHNESIKSIKSNYQLVKQF